VGAGPAHLQALARWQRRRDPSPDAPERALVCEHEVAVWPSRVADVLAGRIPSAQGSVALPATLAAAGVAWCHSAVLSLDAAARELHLADGRSVGYGQLSIDEAGASAGESFPGAREHALCLHPLSRFVALIEPLLQLAATRVLDLVVIVEDPAQSGEGLSLALALAERLGGLRDERARVALVLGGDRLLPGWPEAAVQKARAAAARQRMALLPGRCVQLDGQHAWLDHGVRLACNAALRLAAPSPAPWWQASGLQLDGHGWPQLDAQGRSVSHPEVVLPGRLQPAPQAQRRWLLLDAGRSLLQWRGLAWAGPWPRRWLPH
jgi:NADH dehydrogenase FAD-containing subunit